MRLFLQFFCCGLLTVNIATSQKLDTTKTTRDTVRIGLSTSSSSIRTLPYFGYFGSDGISFQTYAGSNVSNTLRGHLPNFSIDPNPSDVTSTFIRSNVNGMVIDGLPLTGATSEFYNLNSFDYEGIYTVSNPLIQFGNGAGGGVTFLHRKTGAGLLKPRVEFNSYSTLTHHPNSEEAFSFTKSVAYAQDYGPIDARISYSNRFMPRVNGRDGGGNNFRINVGAAPLKNLLVRFVGDRWASASEAKSNVVLVPGDDPVFVMSSTTSQEALHGNLAVEYKPIKWMTIRSQSALAKAEGSSNSRGYRLVYSDVEYKRRFTNFFINTQHNVVRNLRINVYAGVQYDRNRTFSSFTSINGGSSTASDSRTAIKNESMGAGLTFNYSSWLSLDLNRRWDKVSALPQDRNPIKLYSYSTALVFTDLLNLGSSVLTFGKVRASVAKSSVVLPDEGIAFSSSPADRHLFETGVDLSFLNRINLRYSYFSNFDERFVVSMVTSSGFISYTNLGELSDKGWEVSVAANVIDRRALRFTSELMWSTFDSSIRSPSSTSGAVMSPLPDWTSSWLNQIVYRKFFASFLIDARKGGQYYSFTGMIDGSFAKLRDISVGYQFPAEGRLRARISLSARNMLVIYSKSESGANLEGSIYGPVKSVSISASFQFN